MPSNNLILCCPLFLLPSVFPSIRIFSSESALCIRWPKYWSLSFSISPSNEYSELISFRIDWFDRLQSKGLSRVSPTPQFKSINSLALSLLMIQLSHLYNDHCRIHNLDYTDFVSTVMCLLFNMFSSFVIAFFPRIKCLLIHGCSHHLR